MTEFDCILPAFAIWHRYDAKSKADLFSTALLARDQLTLIDPIALPETYRTELESLGFITRIVITNANHARDAANFARTYSAPIFAPAELSVQLPNSQALHDALKVGPLRVIRIEGAASGEVALYLPDDGGTLIVGDAVINFDPYGFAFLPRKYCINQKEMIRSLRKLLDLDVARIFFAHGNPILKRAHERLEILLNS